MNLRNDNILLSGTNTVFSSTVNSTTLNTLIGFRSGAALTTGADNTLIGYRAGDVLTTGSDNIIIGNDADVSSASHSNCIIIGDGASTLFSFQLGLGSVSHPLSASSAVQQTGATYPFGCAPLPANPLGYLIVILNGDRVKIPYYNK